MGKKVIIGIAILLAITVLPVAVILAYDAYLTRNVDAEIVARAPERGNFKPRSVTLPAGEKVLLRVRNVDTVQHGFAVPDPDVDVDVDAIKAGSVKWVEFTTPQETGTYPFYCTVWCSPNHPQMRGKIKVVNK